MQILILLYSFKFLFAISIFGPGRNFASNDVFVDLFDSVRSQINWFGAFFSLKTDFWEIVQIT